MSSNLAVHFSAKKQDHCTPKWLFNQLNAKYKFKADLYADSKNTLCKKYFSKKNPAEQNTWPKGWSFANPEYGKAVNAALRHAAAQRMVGRYSVFLLPARTDTKWFHKIVMKCAQHIKFIEGRLTFEGCPAGAPFPSMLVYFGPKRLKGYPSISTLEKPMKKKVKAVKKKAKKAVVKKVAAVKAKSKKAIKDPDQKLY